jgi:hypothetical protein
MKLIARFELATKTTKEMHLLYREIFNALARTTYGTADRRSGRSNLENIHREISQRTGRHFERP